MATPLTTSVTNWAGNVTFRAERVHRPTSVGELQGIVGASRRLRALGTGHSFNRIADTTGDLVSLADLPADIDVDPAAATVRVAAGVRYAELAAEVHGHGLALPNLGSLPHISVGGAVATGTHGSGDRLGVLATSVRGLELVTAGGDLLTLDRAHADFAGAVVALGCLGVVTHLTLDLVSGFEVRQWVYDGVPREALDAELLASAYSVSAFTGWDAGVLRQVWLKCRDEDGFAAVPGWRGGRLAGEPRHMVPGVSAVHCTPQLGEPGPWHERLPHFRRGFTPSFGEELQSEWLVPRDQAAGALDAVHAVADLVQPVLLSSEVRTVAADDLWLSPAYGRDSVAIHFTWVLDTAAVTPVVAVLEEQLAPYAARPHWAKVFGTDPEVVRGLYPRLADAERLFRRYDPAGVLRNELVDRYLPG